MKRLTTLLKLAMVALIATVGMVACEDEPEAPKAPLAFFSAEEDSENSQLIHFTNETENGITYEWNFGDPNSGDDNTSTDVSPSHEFTDGGEFTVTLTATNEGGDNTYTETINVTKAAAVNIIVNGTFDTDSDWTAVNHYKSDNTDGIVKIEEGVANFSQVPDAGWVHLGLYQEVSLEVGTYAINLDFEIAEISDVWGELYVGKTVPTSGTAENDMDYTDNGIMVVYNAWNCEPKTYAGSAVDYGCVNDAFPKTDGIFEITEAGTYYVHFKTGGGNLGTNGVDIDNVTLFKQ